MQGDARRRGTRTPTVTLSTIGYRPSAIDYRLSAIDYRLSAIGYRLSAIGYRLSIIAYRLWNAKPVCASRELQRRPYRPSAIDYRLSIIGYRLSAIDHRLSAIDYRLSAMECKTRLCRPDRTPTPAHEAPVPPNQDDAGASSHSGTRPCWQRRVRAGERLLPSFLRRHSNPAASGARPR